VTIRSLFGGRARFIGGLHVSYLLLAAEDNKTVKAGTAAAIRQLNYKLRTGKLENPSSADLYIPHSPSRQSAKHPSSTEDPSRDGPP
jgi:hypothetical protein